MCSDLNNSISMLIPVFNAGNELLKTLKSLENIHELGEIIIIDDYSDKINKSFLDSIFINKVRVIENTQSKGISGALNCGIKAAIFEYIGRIDSGDICKDKKRFKKIIDIFSSNKEFNLICSSLITGKNNIVNPRLHYVSNILSPFSKVPHPTWVFKRELINYQYRYDTYRFEDYAFLIENKAKIFILPSVDTYYDNETRMLIHDEIRLTFSKTLFFLSKSKNNFQSYLVSFLYIFLRIIRLAISRKKII